MCGSMVDIQSPTAEMRRGKKKKKERRRNHMVKNIMSASATQSGHNKNVKDILQLWRWYWQTGQFLFRDSWTLWVVLRTFDCILHFLSRSYHPPPS